MESIIQDRNGLKKVQLNRRKAIHERCLNCSCWSYADVTGCRVTECPLYPFRNGRGKQNRVDRAKAIRCYCLWCMSGQMSEVRKCLSVNCPLHAYRQG